jgi:hypothetical protein
MGKKFIGIMVITTMLFWVFGLVGCSTDIDGNYKGFSSGFNYILMFGEYSSIDCAARSEKIEFDIEDVTLDVYFGWRKEQPITKNPPEESFIVLYFGVTHPDESIVSFLNEIDYRNINGLFYMADIPSQDFFSDNYAINMTKKAGKVFNESAKFTVPETIFRKRYNSFNFLVFYVFLSEEEKTYSGSAYALMNIKCEYIDDNTVRLIRSYHR